MEIMETKKRITTFVDPCIKKELEDSKQNRSLSNHVADILIQHVKKNKTKPFTSKKEYGE